MDVASDTVVAILTRAPSTGGKTRLFDELGVPPDPTLLEALLRDTVDAAGATGMPRVVFASPACACEEVARLLPSDVRVEPQAEGTLGARMRAAFERLWMTGATAVLLIGSDLPALSPRTLIDAATRLRVSPEVIVLGPAEDGGYYLVGARRTPDALMAMDGWGTPDVLARTLTCAAQAGLGVSLLSVERDIDRLEDVRALLAASDSVAVAPRTRAWARQHLGV